MLLWVKAIAIAMAIIGTITILPLVLSLAFLLVVPGIIVVIVWFALRVYQDDITPKN